MTNIRRVLAPNPGMMTGPGTNTYLVGVNQIAVIDPGPGIDAHLDEIQAQAGAPITEIWLTHAHPDHATAVPALKERTGAKVLAWPTPNPTFKIPNLAAPDHPLRDGEAFVFDDETYTVIYCPGHASDHVCFFRPADGVLLTGDVVLGRGTVLVAAPDGNLKDYMQSLERLLDLNATLILPGHGDPIHTPGLKLQAYLDHRHERERQILAGLQQGKRSITELVADIYKDVDPRVHPVARLQVESHLLKLIDDRLVLRDGAEWSLIVGALQ